MYTYTNTYIHTYICFQIDVIFSSFALLTKTILTLIYSFFFFIHFLSEQKQFEYLFQDMSRSVMILGSRSSTSNTSSVGMSFTTDGTLFVTQNLSNTALLPGTGLLQKALQQLLGKTAWATKAFTWRAPMARNATAHSYRVPPVCTRSSTMTTSFPGQFQQMMRKVSMMEYRQRTIRVAILDANDSSCSISYFTTYDDVEPPAFEHSSKT